MSLPDSSGRLVPDAPETQNGRFLAVRHCAALAIACPQWN
jgi:hypothetical protein